MADSIYIGRDDAAYPELLGRIADPPAGLYCRGNVTLLDSFCVAVVGTRLASDYGHKAATDIAGNLAAAGVTVVSGLAMGIDAIAHTATLDACGKTIAVLGSGIENLTPKATERLGMRIIDEGGLVISEYPGAVPGAPHTFPKRNRIISGLSRGVLVVEADMKSGSIITAKAALEQDRDVFAVPGSIYWPRSVGSNWLISQGARPVGCAADILECYKLRQIPLPSGVVSTEDPVQKGILALLGENGPMHLDALAASTNHDASRVMAAIAILELKGYVSHQGAGIYRTT